MSDDNKGGPYRTATLVVRDVPDDAPGHDLHDALRTLGVAAVVDVDRAGIRVTLERDDARRLTSILRGVAATAELGADLAREAIRGVLDVFVPARRPSRRRRIR